MIKSVYAPDVNSEENHRRQNMRETQEAAVQSLLERFFSQEILSNASFRERIASNRTTLDVWLESDVFGNSFSERFPDATLADKLAIIRADLEGTSLNSFNVPAILAPLTEYRKISLFYRLPEFTREIPLPYSQLRLSLRALDELQMLNWMERQITEEEIKTQEKTFQEILDWIEKRRQSVVREGPYQTSREIVSDFFSNAYIAGMRPLREAYDNVEVERGRRKIQDMARDLWQMVENVSERPWPPSLVLLKAGGRVFALLAFEGVRFLRLLLVLFSKTSLFFIVNIIKLILRIFPHHRFQWRACEIGAYVYCGSFLYMATILPFPLNAVFCGGGIFLHLELLDRSFSYEGIIRLLRRLKEKKREGVFSYRDGVLVGKLLITHLIGVGCMFGGNALYSWGFGGSLLTMPFAWT